MSIFSKKDKTTVKQDNLQKTIDKTDIKIEKTISDSLEKSSNVNTIQKDVDEVYPWLDQKKIGEPTSKDFPNSIYVQEPKWKHHTQNAEIDNTKLEIKNNSNPLPIPKKPVELKWDKENTIEEPIAKDFPNEIHVESPKWKKKNLDAPAVNKTISKTTAHGFDVKETPLPKKEIVPITSSSREINKDLSFEKKSLPKPSPSTSNSLAINKLKELAAKKETKPVVESESTKKLKELLQRELKTDPVQTSKEAPAKSKPTETKLDW